MSTIKPNPDILDAMELWQLRAFEQGDEVTGTMLADIRDGYQAGHVGHGNASVAIEAARQRLNRARQVEDDVAYMATDAPIRCGRRIRNSVPSWAGSDQIDPCECIRPHAHQGECKCSHLEPDDAVPVLENGRSE